VKGEELINLCQAVEHGNTRFVRNTRCNREGAVLSAKGSGIEVKVGNANEVWHCEECEEIKPAPAV
jgi:hypothetical protein